MLFQISKPPNQISIMLTQIAHRPMAAPDVDDEMGLYDRVKR
jgi:hypothetical protein